MKLHYKGWASKWDERVSRSSPKLAELGTQTSGKDTGWVQRQQGSTLDLRIEQIENMKTRLLYSTSTSTSTTLTEEEKNDGTIDQFWSGDLSSFIETILSSNYSDPSIIPHVNVFIKEVILALIQRIMSNEEMNPGRLQLLDY